MGDTPIEKGCFTLSDHLSYQLPFPGLHFPSAIPIRVILTLGSKPFELNWSNQRKNVAGENEGKGTKEGMIVI